MTDASDFTPPSYRPGLVPLVGRHRELNALVNALHEAGGGRTSVVFISGEPGVGKTRLLHAFPPPDLVAGVTVLRGGASQAEGMPPYLPFLEALGDYVASVPPDRLREEAGAGAGVLATLYPEVAERLGTLPSLYHLPAEQGRLRLYEAVASFLRAIAARQPLILAFDDLQWADAATCDLLVHVVRRLPDVGLLVIGAYRQAEVEENPALVRTLAELNRRRLLRTLPLPGLSAAENRELVARLLQGDVTPKLSELLHRQSEGNPFFAEELLWALLDAGCLVHRGTTWDLVSQPDRLLPPEIVAAVRLRLARIDPDVVEVLRVAAIIGRRFRVGLLAAVMDSDVEQVEDRLLVAVRAQLVRREPGDDYVFVHDKVRETLSSEVGGSRHRRLHHAIGEALERERDALTHRRLADLAFHFVQANDHERGINYALAAGEQALRACAATEAMEQYRTAVALLVGTDGDLRRVRALLGLGEATVLAGEYRQAAGCFHAAVEAALRVRDRGQAAQAWRRLAEVYWRQEAVVEARAAFESALDLLGSEDSPDAAETLLQLADLYASSLGRPEEGRACGKRALAMVERLGHQRLQAAACRVLGNIDARTSHKAQAQPLLERALALALQEDDLPLAAETCGHLANVRYSLGDATRSWEATNLREELGARTQDPFLLRHVDSWRAQLSLGWGDWAAAEQLLERAQRTVERLESPEPLATVHWVRCQLRYCQGRFDEAVVCGRTAVELVRPLGSSVLVWYLGPLGNALAEAGERDEALACFAELHAIVAAFDSQAVERAAAFANMAIGYGRLGEAERAAGCYQPLVPFQGEFYAVLVDRALAVAAIAGGRFDDGERHLAAAEALARRAGLRPELALTLLQRGFMERHAADRGLSAAGGQACISEGLQLAAELGMQLLAQRIVRGPTPGRARRPGRRQWPDGLTDREIDVLRLVAQGRTNRDIAHALVLSEGTIANHLTGIFTKTGADNRAAAAAYALRHGLV